VHDGFVESSVAWGMSIFTKMRSLEGDERDGGTLDSTDGGEDVGAGVEHGKKAAVEEAERPFEKPAAPTQQDGGLGLWSLLPLNPTRPSVGFDDLSIWTPRQLPLIRRSLAIEDSITERSRSEDSTSPRALVPLTQVANPS